MKRIPKERRHEIANRGGPLLPLPDRHANKALRGPMAPPSSATAR